MKLAKDFALGCVEWIQFFSRILMLDGKHASNLYVVISLQNL